MYTNILPFCATFCVKLTALIFLILSPAIASAQDSPSCIKALEMDASAAEEFRVSIIERETFERLNQCTLILVELRQQLRLSQLMLSYIEPKKTACSDRKVTGGYTADQLTKTIADLQKRIKFGQDDCTSSNPTNAGAAVCFTAAAECGAYINTVLNSCSQNCASSTGNCWQDCQLRTLDQTVQCVTAERTCERNRIVAQMKGLPFTPPIKCFGLCPPR
jgi:hypothetical protein